MPPLVANTSQRLFAGFVDVGPLMLISIVSSVLMAPFDPSAVAARLIAAAGLLLKDITGASPGKWLAGLRVSDRDGRPAGSVRHNGLGMSDEGRKHHHPRPSRLSADSRSARP